MRRSARFDATGTYRYGLIRLWDAARPRALFIMLNPSTADAEREDPTIRRCIGFARTWGFGSMEAVNLFAYRTTDPARLPRARDPVGPANDAAIARAAGRAGTIVLAWGHHGAGAARAADVLRLLERRAAPRGIPIVHLGRTRAGAPRHPLYLPRTVIPVPWSGGKESS